MLGAVKLKKKPPQENYDPSKEEGIYILPEARPSSPKWDFMSRYVLAD